MDNRFVILHHILPGGEHWDFMLEAGDTLATWQLASPPSQGNSDPILAVRIANHRKAYLTYEGPVSKDRGRVVQFDAGTYNTTRNDATSWSGALHGGRVSGKFELIRSRGNDGKVWVLRLGESESIDE